MVLKPIRSILILSLILMLLAAFIPVSGVYAMETSSSPLVIPFLDTFVDQVKNGQANELRGVYVPGIMAAAIVQQPEGENEFISPRMQTVTQFSTAARLGSTGLLAHNYLSGQNFFLLKEGQTFYLIYGDGKMKAFVVSKILQYQALVPESTTSDFLDLKDGRFLTVSELFLEIYNRPGQVVFQTCIAANQNPSWGRLFVIAEPYTSQPAISTLVYVDQIKAY